MRGRAWKITTQADPAAGRPTDLVERQFTATRPNQLWVADFRYVATWRGCVCVAFVIDVFARRVAGWRVSSSLRTDFVLASREIERLDARRKKLIETVMERVAPSGVKDELNANAARREQFEAQLGATVQTKRSPKTGDLLLEISLVAGGGFEPPTFGL